MVYKVNTLIILQTFVSPNDFDDVEVILERLQIRNADYYNPRCVSGDKKTIVNVTQNMPLSIWDSFALILHFWLPLFYTHRLAN